MLLLCRDGTFSDVSPLSAAVAAGREGGTWLTVGAHKSWVVCRISNAESAQPVWDVIKPISEDNFCVTTMRVLP